MADLVLQKMPTDVQININGFIGGNLLVGVQDNYSPELYVEMVQLFQQRNSDIRKFLIDEEYVETIDHTIQRDKITKKGRKARGLGGHEAYKEWEAEETAKSIKEEKKLTFAQKNWHWIAFVTLISGWVGDCGKEAILLKWQKPSIEVSKIQDTVIQTLYDTVHIHDTTFVKPTTSTKDSVKKQ